MPRWQTVPGALGVACRTLPAVSRLSSSTTISSNSWVATTFSLLCTRLNANSHVIGIYACDLDDLPVAAYFSCCFLLQYCSSTYTAHQLVGGMLTPGAASALLVACREKPTTCPIWTIARRIIGCPTVIDSGRFARSQATMRPACLIVG